MKYYTSDDYDSLVRYTYKEISELSDVSENYKLNNTKDKHHKHDKLFRKILNDKNEVAKLINMELEPEKELKVRVIPIVIYAGIQKWRTEIAFEDMQPEFRHKKGSSSIFKYNLVDIRDVDEAVKVGTAIARISVIERLNSTEEIIETIKKFAKVMKDKNERQELAEEIKYLLSDRLTKEEIENIEEILIEREGEDAMLHAQMVIRRDFERAKEEGRKEGKKEGIIQVAKKMLAEKMDVNLISKLTGLRKEQFMQ